MSAGCSSIEHPSNSADQPLDEVNLRAFLWENGKMEDLNHLIDPNSGWTLHTAVGIDDQGEILCNGIREGIFAALLLTPNPPDHTG